MKEWFSFRNSICESDSNKQTQNSISDTFFRRRGQITSNLLLLIKEKRTAFLGIAIILVILYHASGYASSLKFLMLFYKGSIGVDIFLFLSGLGLSYSYNKNSKMRFYMNRFLRVYPLFFLYAIIRSLLYIHNGTTLSVWEWICNLTTLSYYQIGGQFTDWYLCALILLYLAFPLLYKITRWETVLIVCYLIVGLFWVFGRPYWTYECLIARIPIFMSGILAYKSPEKLWIVVLGLLACSPVAILAIRSSPLATCSLVFLLIFACQWLLKHLVKFPVVEKALSFCGKYSLELYLGNCLSMFVPMPAFICNDYLGLIWSLGSTALYAFFFSHANMKVKLIIKKLSSG